MKAIITAIYEKCLQVMKSIYNLSLTGSHTLGQSKVATFGIVSRGLLVLG